MDASEIHARRLNAEEVLTPMKGDNFIFPVADEAATLSGRDHEFREPTPRREQLVRSEDLSGELQGEPEGVQPTGTKDDAEARTDFWSIKGDFIYRHHLEPRVQLYVPKDETFPFPLKCTDVTRATSTTLDVLLERRIDEYWNIEGDRDLSNAWTGLTRFTILNEKPPDGYTWSGRRLTKRQTTFRPEHRWPERWKNMSDAAQRKEKQKWAIEKPELGEVSISSIRKMKSSIETI